MRAQLLQTLQSAAREMACPRCPRRFTSAGDFSLDTPRFCELGCRFFEALPRLVDEAIANEKNPDVEIAQAQRLLERLMAQGLPNAGEALKRTGIARAARVA